MPFLRNVLLCLPAALLMAAGCGPDIERTEPPVPVTLDELAVTVDGTPRSFFFSDRAGAMTTGVIGPGGTATNLSWASGGVELLGNLLLRTPSGMLRVEGGRIDPSAATYRFSGGAELEVEPVEGWGGSALLLRVTTAGEPVAPVMAVPAAFGRPETLAGGGLRWRGRSGALVLYGGPDLPASESQLVLPGGGVWPVLLVYSSDRDAAGPAAGIFGRLDALSAARRARLASLLGRGILRFSDTLLTRAANWFALSLDALVVEGEDTLLAPGAPWDGSWDLRAATQSMGGLELAVPGIGIAEAFVRPAARWQDTVLTGRIPLRVSAAGVRDYGAADVTPRFIQEQYEQIVRSADTTLVHTLYPVARRSIEASRTRTDRQGLLRHGPGETALGRDRADRAIEVQSLWYYEQMIGSFLAAYRGRSAESNDWAAAAESTQTAITGLYMDTTRMRAVDHLRPDGRPSPEATPSGLYAFELTPSELFRQEMIEDLVRRFVAPHGIVLEPGGPSHPWLAGQFTYVLTRYDRQDVAYRITGWMAREAMERGMAGALPERYVPRAGADAAPDGLPVYGPGMGEFLRTLYQDYLGIAVDVLSKQIALNPKLPAHITSADATVRAGRSLVRIRYELGGETSRAILSRTGPGPELKVAFIWMLPSGSAWRGSTVLPQEGELRIVFSADDAVAYRDGSSQEIAGKWKLESFSRRGELTLP